MRHPLRHPATWALCAALALTACGSGGDDHPPPPPAATANPDTGAGLWNTAITVDVLANDRAGSGTLTLASAGTPAHGSTAIQNGKVVYTPAAGYFGPDQFSYTVSDGGGQATASVVITVTAQMTLQGRAYDAPLPGAAIEAMVGSSAFSATADAEGRYSLPIQTADPTQFVTISATGVGSQAHVKLVTLVGDTRTLAGNAARDGSLPAQDVTHLTTAQAALATQSNGGAPPTTQTELNTANGQVNSEALLQMAAMIRLVADGGVALPAGVANTQALVMDPAVYQPFAQGQLQTNAVAVNEAIYAIVHDPSLTIAPAPLAQPTTLMMRYGIGGCCSQSTTLFTIRPDGTATVQADSAPIEAKWTVSDNFYVFTFPVGTQPIWYQTDHYFDPTTGQTLTMTVRVNSLVLGQLTGLPGAEGLYGWGGSWVYSYSDGRADEIWDNRDDLGLRMGTPLSQMTVPDTAELTAHPLAGVPIDNALADGWPGENQDMAHFRADGTGQLQRSGATFTWRVEDGMLKLRYASEEHHLARVTKRADGEEQWLARIAARRTDGTFEVRQSLESVMVTADHTAPFTDAELVGTWLSGVTRGIFAEYGEFLLSLQADHTGTTFSRYMDGTVDYYAPFNWTITADGGVHMQRSDDPANYSLRDWRRLHVSGNALFVMEQRADQWRVIRYDKQP